MKRLVLGLAFGLAFACGSHPPPIVTPTPPPVVTPPIEVPAPVVLPIHNGGGHFADANGDRWVWKGATDFQLLKYELDGTPYDQILDQRQSAGANLVRVFGMAKNLFDLNPAAYGDRYWIGVEHLLDRLAKRGLYAELTVFADAQLVMPSPRDQLAHWQGFARFSDRANLFLELVNENSHAGNTIRVQDFPFLAGIMCSHGSGQTDEHPIEPFWNYVTYHARRNGPPDARGATNYDPYEFEAGYPKDRPWIADEGIKTTDAGFALLMGEHGRVGDGGTFHSASGVTSQIWSAAEFEAAKAFFAGASR